MAMGKDERVGKDCLKISIDNTPVFLVYYYMFTE